MLFITIVSLVVIFLDQLSKWIITTSLAIGESVIVIQDFFHITHVYNTGVAFGLFNNNTLLTKILIILGCAIVVYIMKTMRHLSLWHRVASGMMIGGAVGNIIDRIRVGAVIDFLDFRVWPVFNIADTCISLAAGIFIILIMRSSTDSSHHAA